MVTVKEANITKPALFAGFSFLVVSNDILFTVLHVFFKPLVLFPQ